MGRVCGVQVQVQASRGCHPSLCSSHAVLSLSRSASANPPVRDTCMCVPCSLGVILWEICSGK